MLLETIQQQIRKLLRTLNLLGGACRRSVRGADDDGWASDLEGGDPLLEVDRSVVEDLYCRYLADDDYLEKVRGRMGWGWIGRG